MIKISLQKNKLKDIFDKNVCVVLSCFLILLYKVTCLSVCVLVCLIVNPPCVTSNTQKTETNFIFIVTHGRLGLTPSTWYCTKNWDRIQRQFYWPKLVPNSSN